MQISKDFHDKSSLKCSDTARVKTKHFNNSFTTGCKFASLWKHWN